MKTTETTAITMTPKGARVWIQGLTGKGISAPFVLVSIFTDAITLTFGDTKHRGMRKVTQSKGGLVDLQSKRITAWAQGSTEAIVTVISANTIQIKRV
jgi:hypothetical protein